MTRFTWKDTYEDNMKRLDPGAAEAYLYNKDVYRYTAEAFGEGEEPSAFGYLTRGTLNGGIFSIDLTLIADHEKEDCLTAGAFVIDALQEYLPGIAGDIHKILPGVPVELCSWVSEKRPDYIDYLKYCGFTEGRTMSSYEKDLTSREEKPVLASEKNLDIGKNDNLRIEILDPLDPYDRKIYLEANGKGFGFPDSEEGLVYRAAHWGTKVTAWVLGGKNSKKEVISAVSIWPEKNHAAATEDVFCVPEYRRRHLTGLLLEYAFDCLRERGYEKARLNAFSDNTAACSLYEKLGYRKKDTLHEMRIRLKGETE